MSWGLKMKMWTGMMMMRVMWKSPQLSCDGLLIGS